jgi:hypothetical protein
MAVGPETAKSAVLASSWFCPEPAMLARERVGGIEFRVAGTRNC